MFVATFLTFMTIGGFPSFVEDMKVHLLLTLALSSSSRKILNLFLAP